MIERIKEWIVKLLNMFAMPIISNNTSRGISIVVFMFISVCIGLCAWVTFVDIPEKFVLMVDNVTLPYGSSKDDAKTISIGYNSDIHYAGVPHDYLQIEKRSDGKYWKVNVSKTDTLQYFKINNDNPNAHSVNNSGDTKVSFAIPFVNQDGKKDTINETLTGNEVWDEWKQFSEQKDVMAHHLLAHHLLGKGNVSHADSLKCKFLLENTSLRSFFECQKGRFGGASGIKLVILDRELTINGEGYKMSDTLTDERCKVQFFNVTSYHYKDDDSKGDYFQIDGVNYVMKPLVKLTGWGAGHVMLDLNQNDVKVSFPKAVGYVGNVDSLRNAAQRTSGVITFRQAERSFPSSSDIFLPYFAHGYNQDICNLEFSANGGTLTVKDNSNHAEGVANPSSLTQMVPALKKINLKSGGANIDARIGLINNSFIFEYIKLPLLVTLLLLLLIVCPWSPLKTKETIRGLYSGEQLKAYPMYVATLLVVGFAYTICKSMIALKLSYTSPYFEKMTGITPFNTAMMLLVFFTMLLIINHTIVSKSPSRKGKGNMIRKLVSWIVLAVIFAGLCLSLFCIADPQISYGIIDSYNPEEIEFSYLKKWAFGDTAFGANDNHRTVCYALIVVEGVLLVVLAYVYKFGVDWITEKAHSVYGTFYGMIPFKEKASDLWDKLIVGRGFKKKNIKKEEHWNLNVYLKDCLSHIHICAFLLVFALLLWWWSSSFGLFAVVLFFTALVFVFDFVHDAFLAALRTLFPGHIILILILAFGGSALGNFGTAFITLGVVLGLTRALTNVRFTDPNSKNAADLPRHVVLTEMVIISLVYIGGAMVADNGYMTNYIGFLMFVLCIYFVLLRPGSGRAATKTDKKESRWVIWTLIVAVALILALPFICSKIFNPDKVDYSRMSRRVCMYSNFESIQKSGYRYNDSDAEFMVVMSHYMQMKDGGDPLSNDTHFLHSSVSTGQSPVVLNDLSVPVAFFGAYGTMSTTIVYFLLLFSLLLLVLHFSFSYGGRHEQLLTSAMQWRILTVFMWIGTSMYIYFSYLGHLPFTGRLNPGFGVDAVGEVLESAFLLAFMGGLTVKLPKEESKSKKSASKESKDEKDVDEISEPVELPKEIEAIEETKPVDDTSSDQQVVDDITPAEVLPPKVPEEKEKPKGDGVFVLNGDTGKKPSPKKAEKQKPSRKNDDGGSVFNI